MPPLPKRPLKTSPKYFRFPLFLLICGLCFSTCSFCQTDQEKTLFDFINSERQREGLPLLEWDKSLYKVAIAHSKDMAKNDQVAHKGSDGSQPHQRILKAGIFASETAENVARDINVVSAHTSLMMSLYHRDNILDPEFTRGAVAIAQNEANLYVTELFIRQLEDYQLGEARRLLLKVINDFRQQHNLLSLSFLDSLNKMAQSHVEVQSRMNSLGAPLTLDLMAKRLKGTARVNVYTTMALLTLPETVSPNLLRNTMNIGIGYKRVHTSVCQSGCYLITLVFGPEP